MKRFFSQMSLARWIMVLALVLSVALGATGFHLHRKRVDLERALAIEVPKAAQEIQVLSRRYSKLFDEAEREGLKGQADPESYFRKLAAHPKVVIGALQFEKPSPFTPSKGVIDIKYRIRSQDRDRGFDRKQLANFLWLIEEQSRRVRVTHVRLEREGNPKDWEYGNDRWKWDVEVTSRQKDERR